MKIIVSSCLLGIPCRYDGKGKPDQRVMDLGKEHELIPVCPEMLGGLSCPRTPCECTNEKIISKNGEDFTQAFETGAQKALDQAVEQHADLAILQERSPSCGVHQIYDGTFQGHLIEGSGLFTRKLQKSGIPVLAANTLLSCTLNENDLKLSLLKDPGGKLS